MTADDFQPHAGSPEAGAWWRYLLTLAAGSVTAGLFWFGVAELGWWLGFIVAGAAGVVTAAWWAVKRWLP